MNRKETTKFLGNLLIHDKFVGKHWAREVSIDYGTKDVKRVDFMQFEPAGVTSISEIEKGIFICYEIKSCKEDVYSGNGLNFLGEKNYIVTTMECYKDIIKDQASGKLKKHIIDSCPNSSLNYGIMVAIPMWGSLEDEFMNPTPLNEEKSWKLSVIIPCNQGHRKKSTIELLFCMLRSGK